MLIIWKEERRVQATRKSGGDRREGGGIGEASREREEAVRAEKHMRTFRSDGEWRGKNQQGRNSEACLFEGKLNTTMRRKAKKIPLAQGVSEGEEIAGMRWSVLPRKRGERESRG